MRTLTLNALRAGIERLRTKGGAKPDALYDLVNGYVTIDGSVRSRPGTLETVALPAGTKGLCAFDGELVVFSHEPKTIPASTPTVTCQVLIHPTEPSTALARIHFAGPFLGSLYVVAEFADGLVRHYWLQGRSAWTASTMYREGDVVEPTNPNGLSYRARRIGPPNPLWAPDVERNVGDRVEPTAANGYYYEVVNLLSPGDDDPAESGGTGTPTPGGPGAGGAYAFTGTLPDAYIGVPYYNVGTFGDPWKITGGDHVPRLSGTLPAGMSIEKGEQNQQANVYGIPLAAGTSTVTIAVDESAYAITPHSQSFTVHPRPSFGVLDFVRRRDSEKVAMVDAHTARFDTAGGIFGYVGVTSGKRYAEVTITGSATVGIHAASLDNPTISDTGNPAGTYGLLKTAGTYAIALDGGKVWISDAAGAFTGDPAAGTGAQATLDLTNGDAYRLAINGLVGATVAANFGNSAFAYTPPTGFAGWPMPVEAVPVMWTSTGAQLAEVGRHNAAGATFAPASEAGVLDYLRGAPQPGEYVGLGATFGKSAGKWQFEIAAIGNVSALVVGLAKAGFDFTAKKAIGFDGAGDSVGVAHALRDPATGVTWTEVHSSLGGTHASTRTAQVASAVYTFACDFDAGTVAIYRNGTLLQTVTGLPSGTWSPAMSGSWWPTAVLRATDLTYPVATFADWTTTP